EFIVLKTNTAPAKLPVKGSKAVETGRVGRVGPLKPGTSKSLNLTLTSGKYVLLCNLPGHYQAGQRIGFTAT
ncbi:MAG: copper-binding protein, partial [Actinomycetota bacterium]